MLEDVGKPLLYMRYVGAMTLFGRIVGRPLNADDEGSVDQAFADANDVLAKAGSGKFFRKVRGGGYSMFD